MISKELASAVLEEDVENVSMLNLWNMVNIDYKNIVWGDKRPTSINIYQLAHLCKEWADKLGYEILSGLGYAVIIDFHAGTDAYGSPLIKDIEFENNTEPESVFKACEWLLDKE